MPLYEYECRDCGDRFEKMLSFSQADQSQECPSCGSPESQRHISIFSSPSLSSSTSAAGSCGAPSGSRFT
jgi:putative FmdB family regulatory protein